MKRLRKELAKVLLDKEMMEKCVRVSPKEGVKVNEALNIMASKSREHKLSDILPKSLQDIDPFVDYDLAITYCDKITNEYTICIPNMPHLSKNIVTTLELSGVKKPKRKVKYGTCPIYLLCIKDIWLALDGGPSQLQEPN